MNSISKNKSNTMESVSTPNGVKRIKTAFSDWDPKSPKLKKNQTDTRSTKQSNMFFYDEEEERFQLSTGNYSARTVPEENGFAVYKTRNAVNPEREKETYSALLKEK